MSLPVDRLNRCPANETPKQRHLLYHLSRICCAPNSRRRLPRVVALQQVAEGRSGTQQTGRGNRPRTGRPPGPWLETNACSDGFVAGRQPRKRQLAAEIVECGE